MSDLDAPFCRCSDPACGVCWLLPSAGPLTPEQAARVRAEYQADALAPHTAQEAA